MSSTSDFPGAPSPWQHRSMATAANGMVASASPLATLAGAEVLKAGGNAVDAAVAVAGVLDVVLPMMCGLGGDVFMVVYLAKEGRLEALNGSGVSPFAATREYFAERGYRKMPLDGVHSVAVPGAVDAYFTALERWGTMPLAELWQPAVAYAERGFVLSEITARWVEQSAPALAKYPTSRRVFLPTGRPPGLGEVLAQRDLAESMRAVMEGGREVFYKGELAKAIVSFLREEGGLFTEREFAEHTSDVYTPISTTYRGYEVYETAPPSQGHIVLEELNIVEGYDLGAMGFQSAEAIHLMAEAKKLAFGDRLRHSSDPRLAKVPLAGLLSKEYAAKRRAEIDPERALPKQTAGDPWEFDGDTTYFAVVDKDGNCVSFIQSLSAAFGSKVVAGNTGITLNNRAGRGFSLEAGHPNVLAPGKKTMHTLNAYLVCRDGKPWLVGGTPGGDQQPQWNMQVLSALIDSGLNVQQAAEAPRWASFPGTDPANIDEDLALIVEERIPAAVREALAAKGHDVRTVGPYGAGSGVQLIQIDLATGARLGGSDPRVDGCALGY
ncbi:MAG: gamma-glutamyltransferase [Dehalococcoidales bacterium]|nr:gamma-glutamyltransferase [Dehalococcoidales bacterium]